MTADRPPELIDAGSVVLRRSKPDDACAVAAAVGASLDHLAPWLPWATPASADPTAQRERSVGLVREWDEGFAYTFVALAPGESNCIGSFGLHRRVGGRGLEIGYWVHVDHTRKGYATAAVSALTETALALTDVERVEIHCDEANDASAAIPRRLGYRLDRVVDRPVEAPGESGRYMVWVRHRNDP